MKSSEQVLFFKACPRCRGDMHINRDLYGTYKECLQCGNVVDIADKASRPLEVVARARRKVA